MRLLITQPEVRATTGESRDVFLCATGELCSFLAGAECAGAGASRARGVWLTGQGAGPG